MPPELVLDATTITARFYNSCPEYVAPPPNQTRLDRFNESSTYWPGHLELRELDGLADLHYTNNADCLCYLCPRDPTYGDQYHGCLPRDSRYDPTH